MSKLGQLAALQRQKSRERIESIRDERRNRLIEADRIARSYPHPEGRKSAIRTKYDGEASASENKAKQAMQLGRYDDAAWWYRKAARAHFSLSAITGGGARDKHLEWAHELRESASQAAKASKHTRTRGSR